MNVGDLCIIRPYPILTLDCNGRLTETSDVCRLYEKNNTFDKSFNYVPSDHTLKCEDVVVVLAFGSLSVMTKVLTAVGIFWCETHHLSED